MRAASALADAVAVMQRGQRTGVEERVGQTGQLEAGGLNATAQERRAQAIRRARRLGTRQVHDRHPCALGGHPASGGKA